MPQIILCGMWNFFQLHEKQVICYLHLQDFNVWNWLCGPKCKCSKWCVTTCLGHLLRVQISMHSQFLKEDACVAKDPHKWVMMESCELLEALHMVNRYSFWHSLVEVFLSTSGSQNTACKHYVLQDIPRREGKYSRILKEIKNFLLFRRQ